MRKQITNNCILLKFKNSKLFDYKFTERSEDVYNLISKYLETDYTLNEYLDDDTSHQLSVYCGGKLVAATIIEIKGDRMYNDYCAVEKKYRNKGINKTMLLKIIEYGKQYGIVTFTAHVREKNIQSLKSHQSVGFKIHTEYKGTYDNGDVKLLLYMNIC